MSASEKSIVIFLFTFPVLYFVACTIYGLIFLPPKIKGANRIKRALKVAVIYFFFGGRKADDELDNSEQ